MVLCKRDLFQRKLTITSLLILQGSLFSMEIHAENNARFEFDNAILMGNAKNNDLSSFNTTELAPGSYIVDIYVNDIWRGRQELIFTKNSGNSLVSCYSGQLLNNIGINSQKMNKQLAERKSFCGNIAEWDTSGSARERLDSAQLDLHIEIPQAYLSESDSNYIQPELWQQGIPAISLGYSADYYSAQQRGDNRNSSDSAWLGMDVRGSAGGWLLEHLGGLDWDNRSGTHYSSHRTTLKRPIVGWQSMLSAGQFYTDSQMFDGISLLGIALETEDQMRPDNTLNWAPVIRGVAETNARITVTQDGRTIHQTSVPAGPFAIDSILPANTGGELLVTVQESDGRIRRFSVPYSTVTQLLKPGVSRYNLSIGAVDESDNEQDPLAAQVSWQYGVNNTLTFYTGASGFERYQSALLGSGLNTSWGAIALDITHSRFNDDERENQGQQYRISYNRTIPWSQTSLWFEGKMNSQHYYGQRDALDELDSNHEYQLLREKQSYSVSVNQPLIEQWGSIYLSGSIKKYWDQQNSYRQYAMGYTNSWGNLTWNISAQRFWNEDDFGSVTKDDQVSLIFSYYLPRSNSGYTHISSETYSNNGKAHNTRLGFTTTSDYENNLVWGANTSYARGGEMDWGANGTWRSPYTMINGTWSQGSSWHQASTDISGLVVGHAGGVTFSPERSDTLALVYAPDAKGAHLDGVPGTRFDSNGYAIMPWLRPWRVNEIIIDPKGAEEGISFAKTQNKVAPYQGNVVSVVFETKMNRQQIIRPRPQGQQILPFGATIRDNKNNHVGYVGQGGMLYIDETHSPEVYISTGQAKCTVVLKTQEAICR